MPKSSNAGKLIAMFGGAKAMSRATGISEAVISRWTSEGTPRVKRHGQSRRRTVERAGHGKVPWKYNEAIMIWARHMGNDRNIRKLLDWTCPTCGQSTE